MEEVINKMQAAVNEFNAKIELIKRNDLTDPSGLKIMVKLDGSVGLSLDVETIKKR